MIKTNEGVAFEGSSLSWKDLYDLKGEIKYLRFFLNHYHEILKGDYGHVNLESFLPHCERIAGLLFHMPPYFNLVALRNHLAMQELLRATEDDNLGTLLGNAESCLNDVEFVLQLDEIFFEGANVPSFEKVYINHYKLGEHAL